MKNKGNMADYRKRKMKKARQGSQTPGKTKGDSCQADGLDRIFANRSRARKMYGYQEWLTKTAKYYGNKQ